MCLDLTRTLLEKNETFSFNVTTASGFNFSFLNQDFGIPEPKLKKKKSPSQIRRNKQRMKNFIEEKAKTEFGSPESVLENKKFVDYEIKVEAHPTCDFEDIHEAVNVNFQGALDTEKVKKSDTSRNFELTKPEGKTIIKKIENEFKNLQLFKIRVKENEFAEKVIDGWKLKPNFDDFAFKKSDCKTIRIKVWEVQKL